MDTTATNKRVRELISDLEEKRLIPNPKFQRRLVWAQKHKAEFINTILNGLPFPEIYIAAGNVDVETGKGYSMLVDGQQRITTIYEYFSDSPNLELPPSIPRYADLSVEKKKDFLEYKVVVRDLGNLEAKEVVEIFERINSTSYSLNAIEISNARYDNELKDLAEDISSLKFWDDRGVFRINEIKRMQDINFILTIIITIISDYFNRDDRIEEFLIRFNYTFESKSKVQYELQSTIGFIDDLSLSYSSRAWQIADLFTLIVETHRVLFKEKKKLDQKNSKSLIESFYIFVDDQKRSSHDQAALELDGIEKHKNFDQRKIERYYSLTVSGTNNRANRIERGYIFHDCALVPD